MACIQFTSPNWDINSASSINDYIEAIDVKFQEAGLIRETVSGDYDNSTFEAYYTDTVVPFYNSSQNISNAIQLTKLTYTLPIGDGFSVLFEDVPDTDYKAITDASYDDTNVKLEVIYQSVKTCANSGYSDYNRYALRAILQVNGTLVYRTGTTTNGTGVSDNVNNVPSVIDDQSYISLTNDFLGLLISNHAYKNAPSSYNIDKAGYRYLMHFMMYRKNGRLVCYTNNRLPTGATSSSIASYSDSIALYSATNNLGNFLICDNVSYNFNNWQYTATTTTYNGSYVYYPFYAIYYNLVEIVPDIITTKQTATTIGFQDFIVFKNNEKVKQQFINVGLTESIQRPVAQNATYSLAFIYEPTINYTTESV